MGKSVISNFVLFYNPYLAKKSLTKNATDETRDQETYPDTFQV